jgi:hypothetical protein
MKPRESLDIHSEQVILFLLGGGLALVPHLASTAELSRSINAHSKVKMLNLTELVHVFGLTDQLTVLL